MPRGTPKNPPERVEDAQLIAAVMNHRKSGLKFPEISKALGINETQARSIVDKAVADYDRAALQDTGAMRAMIAMRYEELYSAFHPKAVADTDYRAAEICISVLRDTSKLFNVGDTSDGDTKAGRSIRVLTAESKDRESPRYAEVLADIPIDDDGSAISDS